jgi:HEAT repeat protein
MAFLTKLFGPNIDKLKERGDGEALREIVSGGKAEHRVEAISALVELEDGGASEALASALGDSDPAVDRAAESALRDLGVQAADALAAGLSRPIGDRALGLLRDLGDAGAEPLRNAAASDEEAGRRRAVSGLLDLAATTRDDATRELCFRTVLAALGDRAPACRARAARGLSSLGDPRAARALAAQLKDGDETVRAACRSTLAEIGSPAVPYLVDALADRNRNSRLLAAGLLAEIDTAPVEVQDRQALLVTLFDLLDSKDDALAEAASTAIGGIPAVDVIEAQLERLEDPNSDEREETESLVRRLLEHGAVDPVQREAANRRLDLILAAEPDEPEDTRSP